jgi:WD40 repeat protein
MPAVLAVAISPIANGQEPPIEWMLRGLPSQDSKLSFSRDGSLFAAAAPDGATVWRVGTPVASARSRPNWGKYQFCLPTPARTTAVALSPDGRSLASGDERGNLLIFDVATRGVIGRVLYLDSMIRSIQFDPAGQRLTVLTGSAVWTASGPDWLPQYVVDRGGDCFAVSHDGTRLAVGWYQGTILYAMPEATFIQFLPGAYATALAFSSDSSKLYVTSESPEGRGSRASQYNRNGVLQAWSPFDAHLTDASLSPDGTLLAVTSAGGVRLLQTANLSTNGEITGFLTRCSWRNDDHLYVSGALNTLDMVAYQVRVLDRSLTSLGRVEGCVHGNDADWSADGRRLVLAADNEARVFSGLSGATIQTFPVTTGCRSAALSPDGRLVALLDGSSVRVFSADTGALEREFEMGEGFGYSVDFSPDGRFLAATSRTGLYVADYKMWLTSDWSVLWERRFPGWDTTEIEFTPNSRYLCLGGIMLSTKTGEIEWESSVGHNPSFSQDGAFIGLEYGSWLDRSDAYVTRARSFGYSYEHTRLGEAEGDRTLTVSILSNPRYAVQATLSGRLRRWDFETNDYSLSYQREALEVEELKQAPDGSRIAAVRRDGTILVFRNEWLDGVKVPVSNIRLIAGEALIGGLASILKRHDTLALTARKVRFEGPDPAVELWFEGTCPSPDPKRLEFRARFGANSYSPECVVEIWNWNTMDWDVIDRARVYAASNGASVDLTANGDLSRYVGQGNLLRGRLRFVEYQFTLDPFSCWVDQVAWFIEP